MVSQENLKVVRKIKKEMYYLQRRYFPLIY